MARKLQAPRSDSTILVVDDQEETLVSVRSLLEREGHSVLTAACGEHALDLFRQNNVDLLLVDYMMPRMNGAELVREIRGLDPFVQVILQTGYAGERPARLAVADLDIQGYHDKGDGPEKLLLWVDIGLKTAQLIRRLRDARATVAPTPTIVVAGGRDGATGSVQALFAAEGLRVMAVDSNDALIELCIRERPDLLVVDQARIGSPAELVRRVRAVHRDIGVLLLCRDEDSETRRDLVRELELDGIDSTDADPGHLCEVVECILTRRRRGQTTRRDEELRNLVMMKLCHELRTPLQVIRGYAEILRELEVQSIEDIVPCLEAAADTALGLAQDYLDLARLESADVTPQREPIALDALLEDLRALAVRQIGTRPLRIVITPPFGGAFIHTDGQKLRAILVQLMTNAITFSPSGEILLTVRSTPGHTEFVLIDGRLADEQQALVHAFAADSWPGAPANGPLAQDTDLVIARRLSLLLGATLTVSGPRPAGRLCQPSPSARSAMQAPPRSSHSAGAKSPAPSAESGALFTLTLPVALRRRAEALGATLH